MDVAHEELAAVLLRPGAAEVDISPQWAWPPPAASDCGCCRRAAWSPSVVAVVGDRLDVVVGVRVEVLAGLPLVAAALDDVEAGAG